MLPCFEHRDSLLLPALALSSKSCLKTICLLLNPFLQISFQDLLNLYRFFLKYPVICIELQQKILNSNFMMKVLYILRKASQKIWPYFYCVSLKISEYFFLREHISFFISIFLKVYNLVLFILEFTPLLKFQLAPLLEKKLKSLQF
jgi:hypothetical protein